MAETEFKYDVFISYSHKDEEWVVNTLLPALETAGLTVCIDYRDFDAGKPSIVNMEDAVDESRHTVLVLTPNWTGSEWTDFEAVLTQTDDPVGRRQKMIPIMLEKCDPPKRIKSLTYVDFMRLDRLDNAWTQLFKALGKPNAPIPSSTAAPETVSRDSWYLAHPYPMPPNFTGRKTELQMLDDWLADNTNRLFILRALGGFGKSALAWQWINTHVNPAEWNKLVWWSFYEGDASFEHFIEETLKYLKLDVPQGQRPQVDALLKAMGSQKILLIMDGFERALRAYSSMNAAYQGDSELPSPLGEGLGGGVESQLDCVNINAEIFLKSVCSLPNIKSKVLMTTRLTPRAVKPHGQFMLGCREVELTSMQPADAVEFFHKQGIKGTHAEIEAACAPYGYHPLSLRLLAGRILKDFENPADIVVAQKLKIDGDIIQQKHHVLEVSYNSLPEHEQKLLSTIACFRSPVELKTLEAITKDVGATHELPLREDLHDLVTRGLLHFDEKNKKFDLHPIVRRYTYERLTAPARTAAHTRLMDYFETVPKPEKIKKLEDLAPVIELYYHMVKAGNLDEAVRLFYVRLCMPLYFQFGAYQVFIELQSALFDEKTQLPRLKNEKFQARVLNDIANAYCLNGAPHYAVPLFLLSIESDENNGNKKGVAIGLGNLAHMAQLPIGALSAAERNLLRYIQLSVELGIEDENADAHYELGRLLSYIGNWEESVKELMIGLEVREKERNIQAQSIIWSYRALRVMMMERANLESKSEYLKSSIQVASHALELAKEDALQTYYTPVDHMRAYWVLGAVFRENEDLTQAEENLSNAIRICRQINMVQFEANILLDLARLRYDQKNYEEAKSLADEALLITERCGYVLQGADVNLFLAQCALEQEKDKVKAKAYAEEALKLATCDGPPYYYKVAYEEAERFLENLK